MQKNKHELRKQINFNFISKQIVIEFQTINPF